MMKIAVITGASAGLGEEFAKQMRDYFPEVEQVWLIARRRERLEELAEKLESVRTEILPLDLCDKGSFSALAEKLAAEKPDVRLLINNAGCGYLGDVGRGEVDKQVRMTDLNVTALTAVSHIVIPYMSAGSHIINVSSIASFCVNPRMTVYSSTKAYVSSFTRGLACELKGAGIGVTAVCPGPMATEFLEIGRIAGNSKTFETLPYCDPKQVVAGTLAAARAGKVMYTPKAFYKFYRVLAKVLPHALVAPLAKC